MIGTRRLVGAGLEVGLRIAALQFLKEARQAPLIAQETLTRILELNGETAWGRDRGLNRLSTSDAFQDLPLTTYRDYEPYVERIAAGEPNVLSREPVTYLALTSGTTGPQKMIPVTRRQTRIVVRHMFVPMGLALRSGVLGPIRGRMLQVMTEHVSGTTAGGIPMGAATSGGLQRMGWMLGLIWTSPMSVVRVQDQAASRYLHLLFALGEEHLWTLICFFPSTLLFVLRDLQARASELLRDLADGTITRNLDLPTDVREEISRALQRQPARARALTTLLDQGRFTVHDIWPDVRAVLSASSGTFGFYVDQLRPFLGGVPVFSPVYSASEAVIGVGVSLDRPGYVLCPSAAYVEFLPLEEADDPAARPLALNQIETGQDYEVVLTTYTGLTRYRLGDVVRAVGWFGEAPVIEFVERRGQIINVVGEKTSEAQISRAFEDACREVGAAVVDYVVTPDATSTPARYLLLVEGLGRGNDVASEVADVSALLQSFERRLREVSPDYDDARRIGELAPMVAHVLAPGSFERFRDLRSSAGASPSQVKVPHVLPDPAAARRYFALPDHGAAFAR